jgi:hypothetical protein
MVSENKCVSTRKVLLLLWLSYHDRPTSGQKMHIDYLNHTNLSTLNNVTCRTSYTSRHDLQKERDASDHQSSVQYRVKIWAYY